MAGHSGELTRRMHRRDDKEEQSNRKHRDRRRRHRSKQGKEETRTKSGEELEGEKVLEIKVEAIKLGYDGDDGGGGAGKVVVSSGIGLTAVDQDMEEGEILEDDGLFDCINGDVEKVQKNLAFDVDSGGIGSNGYDNSSMGVNQENVKRSNKHLRKLVKDSRNGKDSSQKDCERTSSSGVLAQGDYALKYHEDDLIIFDGGDKIRNPGYDVERRQRICYSSEKRQRIVVDSCSHEKSPQEGCHNNLLRSPERLRARSSSRSFLRETSIVGTSGMIEEPYHKERKQQHESSDERIVARDKYYRHDRVHDERNKDECSSSRFKERMETHYSREIHERYSSRDVDQVRDRETNKQREEREKKRDSERGKTRIEDKDWGERKMVNVRASDKDNARKRDRDWEIERETDRDRVIEKRNKDRNGGREGIKASSRSRNRDKDWENEVEEASSRPIFFDNDVDGFINRDNGSRDLRDVKYLHRERSRRTGLGSARSQSNPKERDRVLKRENDRQEEYQERIAMQLAEQEEDDLDRIKEESRRRRQAILDKYKNQHAQQQIETQSQVMDKEQVGQSSEQLESVELTVESVDSPVEDIHSYDDESSFSVGKSPTRNDFTLERPSVTGGLGEGSPKSERSVDMFCDDIYRESPVGVRKMSIADDIIIEKSGLHDNWDDAEGYYVYRIGEIIDGRYEILATHGKGVFSTVVRAKDLKAEPGDPEEVAIKIIRNNETMYKAGMEELVILKKLVSADPENKRHCVRFVSTFKYRNHLCLVFESLNMNLREVLKKFGRNIGLKLTAVRAYTKQLFVALKHLKKCGVLHCDIKPDNILVNEAKNTLKLCDFGNAMFAGNNEITPYLVSRFYRAPEIILGLPYDHPMDIWSVGCCLYELYTGKVLFPGHTNNDMLHLQMDLKGPFPKKMLRKGGFVDHHFDQDLNFLSTEEDPVTKKVTRRLIVNVKPKDFGSLILGSPAEDPKMVANYKDLMEKIFVLDPDKRLDVSQALSHPFITGK